MMRTAKPMMVWRSLSFLAGLFAVLGNGGERGAGIADVSHVTTTAHHA